MLQRYCFLCRKHFKFNDLCCIQAAYSTATTVRVKQGVFPARFSWRAIYLVGGGCEDERSQGGESAVKELVDFSKRPGNQVNYGGTIGSFVHLGSEQLRATSGANFTFVSYQGLAPAINDLMGGHIQFMFNEVTSVMQPVAAGQMKPLAVAYGSRVPWLPNVPTFAEAGFPDIEVTSWYAMMGRAGTPKATVDLLSKTLQEIMKDPEFKKRYFDIGAFTVGSTPEELAAFIKTESDKWTRLVKQVGIEPN